MRSARGSFRLAVASILLGFTISWGVPSKLYENYIYHNDIRADLSNSDFTSKSFKKRVGRINFENNCKLKDAAASTIGELRGKESDIGYSSKGLKEHFIGYMEKSEEFIKDEDILLKEYKRIIP